MGEKDKIKTPYLTYAEENSVGGLKFVLTGTSVPKRITWLIILLACLAGFGYIVRNNFTKIIKVPTATTVSSRTETVLNFPAITICNLNIFSAQVVRDIEMESL
jgi:acid-sensing ion channel 2